MASIPHPLRLSQGHLDLLETCPRKFQHWVLDQLGTPEAIDQQERLIQGARFHLLLQQWWLELPITPLLQTDPQMQQWFQAFQQASPQIVDVDAEQQPESDRSLEMNGYLLTVRYDLLTLGAQQAKILDWKTYPHPQSTARLEHKWQTRLYPFVLAETSDYQPEQIAIVYWFFQTEATSAVPQSLPFPYNRQKHQETRQKLTQLLQQLTEWLERYQAGEPFPQVGWELSSCGACSFAARCGRTIAPMSSASDDQDDASDWSDRLPDSLPSLAEIEEIPL
jgi:hypothetical protein